MTSQQKNKIKSILNPSTITNTVIGGIILFFMQTNFKENKESIIQSENTYKLMMEIVLPQIKSLDVKTDNLEKFSKLQIENIKEQIADKNNYTQKRVDELKDEINLISYNQHK